MKILPSWTDLRLTQHSVHLANNLLNLKKLYQIYKNIGTTKLHVIMKFNITYVYHQTMLVSFIKYIH